MNQLKRYLFSFSVFLSFSAWDKEPQIGESVLLAHEHFVRQEIIAYIKIYSSVQKAAGTLPLGSVSFRRKQQTSALGKLKTKSEGKRWLEQMSSFVTIPQPVGKEDSHKNGESSAFKYNRSFYCFLTGESILQKTILQWASSIIFLLFALQQNIEISSKTSAWLSNTTSNVCRLTWRATYGGTRTEHRGEVSYWRSGINWEWNVSKILQLHHTAPMLFADQSRFDTLRQSFL